MPRTLPDPHRVGCDGDSAEADARARIAAARLLRPDRRTTGRRTPLTAAQQALAASYLQLSLSVGERIKAGWPNDRPDFEAAAALALVEAARTFDPGRGTLFGTYAGVRILNAVRDVRAGLLAAGFRVAHRAGERREKIVTVPLPAGLDRAARAAAPGVELLEDFERLIRRLPPHHRAVMRLVYRDGLSQKEAAAALHRSRGRVCVLCGESIRLLALAAGAEPCSRP